MSSFTSSVPAESRRYVVEFAPLEGITDAIYRHCHHLLFGGVDHYYTPFVSPTQNQRLETREKRILGADLPEVSLTVPQVLAKEPELFLWAAHMFEDLGFQEINLNCGCPSGTVTSKGKGAGMLRSPSDLRRFLDRVCVASPLPVSVKTRLGFEDVTLWPELLSVFEDYPLASLTVHARTRDMFYRGEALTDVFPGTEDHSGSLPLIYNGNLFLADDCRAMMRTHPHLHGVMLGRGMLANPALGRMVHGGDALTVQELRQFHDLLFETYRSIYPAHVLLGKMREVTKYLCYSFDWEETKKDRKAMLKSSRIDGYLEAVERLFSHPLYSQPAYFQGSDQNPWP
ncbi:MAG: tRNA-dihydrouridine synthase family protein [Clostridia bacterium]|nr:tRNA-dihydrouridine synthase family protein [Clostridia bacterium]